MAPNSTYPSYEEALRSCHGTARAEYRVARQALEDVRGVVGELQARVEREIAAKRPGRGRATSDAHKRLVELDDQLDRAIHDTLASAERALETKRERLGRFTVTLSGRTMAGKSTIREALTCGDGATIGKGAQRTTRDVREYDWNHLRIVDTPGIGAYRGQTDRDIALSMVDRSDLLLFLASSDGIQEDSFRGMQAIRNQNKPIVFVLNVKRDLTRKVFMKRFLRDPSSVMGRKHIQGHIRRIEALAGGELGMRRVTVVPIHAQAAFLATLPEHTDPADALHRASGLDALMRVMEGEVCQRGPVRRVQTILDGTTNTIMDLQEQLYDLSTTLNRSAKYLKDKFGELDTWLDGYIDATNRRFGSEAAAVLYPLRQGVSAFVDENIERSDVGQRWKDRVDACGLEPWMTDQQNQVLDEVRVRLEEFQREMDVEAELTGKMSFHGPSRFDPFDIKRTLRWVSAGGAALVGVAAIGAWIGAANFWNPVGWVAGAVSIVALGLSWLFSDRESKLQRHKSAAADQLRHEIDDMEFRLAARLRQWFYDHITSKLVRGIRRDTRALYDGMFRISRQLQKASEDCDAIVQRQNIRLITRVAEIHGLELDEKAFKRVVRDPGLGTKILWSGHASRPPLGPVVGQALGEWIDGVAPGPRREQVAAALAPARIHPRDVHIQGRTARVRPSNRERGRAIGTRGSNVRLASRLVRMKIEIPRR